MAKKITKKQFLLLLAGAFLSFSFGGVISLFRKDKVSASVGYGSKGYGS